MTKNRHAFDRSWSVRSSFVVMLSIVACGFALSCTRQQERVATPAVSRTVESASTRDALSLSYAEIFADENAWPVRLWLEEPLLDETGAVRVPARRLGVLVHLEEDGDARIDFGRYGSHTVPASRTNLVSEALRVRSGEATKTLPNLVGMLATRLVDPASPELSLNSPLAEVPPEARLLLVFADPFSEDMQALGALLAPLGDDPALRLVALVPLAAHPDAAIHAELRSQHWTEPFVLSAMARSYVPAMLEPDAPRPWLRLCTANGRILVEGPPSEATVAEMVALLARKDR